MARKMNFNPGPACLPLPALEKASEDLIDFSGTGMSILEVSHRSPEYDEVHTRTQKLIKELLGVGDDYHVLFLGGGASTQFAMVPMNFLGEGQSADYVVTGSWAKKAIKEAKILGQANVAASTEEDGKFTRVPKPSECEFSSRAAYAHITTNNTIFGTQWHELPSTEAPLVADMSSDIFWRPIDASRFDLIYAGAQKNLGPAGVTVVVIRDAMLQKCRDGVPTMLSYKTHAEKNSLFNTPPCFPIYMVMRTLEWVQSEGGLEEMERRNRKKAELIYGTIDDNPDFFRAPVDEDSRSYMNVVFRLPSEDLEKKFIEAGKEAGMSGLKGHRSVGGIRVSIYNAVEVAWVEKIVDLMKSFAKKG
jgi:phosphoserine aminotransferase